MKVRELIELLEFKNPECEVIVDHEMVDGEDLYWEPEYLEEIELEDGTKTINIPAMN